MIYPLLQISCDFCSAGEADEFSSPEEARKLMAEHRGWDTVRVKNGSVWDRCKKCKEAKRGED